MKISVITLHAVANYGSALQAYATQRIFSDLGHMSEMIDYRRKAVLPQSIWEILMDSDYSFAMKLKLVLIKPSSIKARKVFDKFLDDNIEMTSQRYTLDEDFINYPIDADVFCTGSDQVWNSDWHDGIPEPFYLSFVPDNKKKIAFSASFGKSLLNEEEKERTAELLSRYDAISVREASGVDVINDLGIEGAVLVLDPTQIVNPQVWYDLAPKTSNRKKYVLVYQLCNNKIFERASEQFAKNKGLELIRLCTRYDQLRKPGKGVVLPPVPDFLALIRDADYVLTDSFHATSFCLIFHKNFVCFKPSRFSNRLESILQIVGLQNHMMSEEIDISIIDEKIEYDLIDEKLCNERNKGINYLMKALDMESFELHG